MILVRNLSYRWTIHTGRPSCAHSGQSIQQRCNDLLPKRPIQRSIRIVFPIEVHNLRLRSFDMRQWMCEAAASVTSCERLGSSDSLSRGCSSQVRFVALRLGFSVLLLEVEAIVRCSKGDWSLLRGRPLYLARHCADCNCGTYVLLYKDSTRSKKRSVSSWLLRCESGDDITLFSGPPMTALPKDGVGGRTRCILTLRKSHLEPRLCIVGCLASFLSCAVEPLRCGYPGERTERNERKYGAVLMADKDSVLLHVM